MKSHTIDAKRETRIVYAMLMSTPVLRALISAGVDDPFHSKWANLLFAWSSKYWQKYEQAPQKQIVPIFQEWADRHESDEQVELVSRFLGKLDRHENDDSNPEFLIDSASELLNEVKISKLALDLQALIDVGRVSEAKDRLASWKPADIGSDSAINVFEDIGAIAEAFESKTDPLFTMPGDLGRFLNPFLERDGFIGFMGAAKRGKSHWLNAIAFAALRARKKVAIFQCGDLSRGQALMRIATRVAKRPRRAGEFQVPNGFFKNDDGEWRVSHDLKSFPEQMTPKDVEQAYSDFREQVLRSDETFLKLSCHPTKSLSPAKLESIIDGWNSREDWVPDVIICDYADIMAPSHKFGDPRDGINSIWEDMRAISQKRKCLLVTATQTNTASYGAEILRRDHFANDRRKFDHVTAMVGINQTSAEKLQGLFRLNILAARDDEYAEERCVMAAGNLAFCNPCMKSKL